MVKCFIRNKLKRSRDLLNSFDSFFLCRMFQRIDPRWFIQRHVFQGFIPRRTRTIFNLRSIFFSFKEKPLFYGPLQYKEVWKASLIVDGTFYCRLRVFSSELEGKTATDFQIAHLLQIMNKHLQNAAYICDKCNCIDEQELSRSIFTFKKTVRFERVGFPWNFTNALNKWFQFRSLIPFDYLNE